MATTMGMDGDAERVHAYVVRGSIIVLSLGIAAVASAGACGGSRKGYESVGEDAGTSAGNDGSTGSSGGSSGGNLVDDGGGVVTSDPATCAEAAQSHSYVGCDYWPTVTANIVWSIFDFAVVVANTGVNTATVTVTGPSNTNQTVTVDPNSLTKIYLPWVPALKGQDMDNCGTTVPFTESVLARSAAFHLVSSVPVTVYQFNALEYAGQGGPPGKDWSTCPGYTECTSELVDIGCYSFTNDASLLLPSTAMTGNYRVMGHGGWGQASMGSFTAITATADDTTVTLKVSSTGAVLAGTNVAATAAGGTLTLSLNAGDVAQLMGEPTSASDLSGSLLQATHPVQVITGMPCIYIPDSEQACDHLEESNFPAETLGQDYVVVQPTGPLANPVGHQVRIYGNFDGTTLTYTPSQPAGCPSTIDAGEVADCGIVEQDFEVKGDNSFAVGTFTQGASVVDPEPMAATQQGDPDQSLIAAVAQYRIRYIFLAPTDYTNNYAVIVGPPGTAITLDGVTTTAGSTYVGSTGFGVTRLRLEPGTNAGAHVLTASNPVGLQVMGYGLGTSYQYPGGLDLALIAPPPTQ
jgi:hypothetical protein